MHIFLIDGNEHQLEDLRLFTDHKITNVLSPVDVNTIKELNDDILIVNHGTRFLRGVPVYNGHKVQAPKFRIINLAYVEELPLPEFSIGVRPNYQYSRSHNHGQYSISSHCVYLSKETASSLKQFSSIDASLIELGLRCDIEQFGLVCIGSDLPIIPASDVDELEKLVPIYPVHGKPSLLEHHIMIKNALHIKGMWTDQHAVLIGRSVEGLNHKTLRSYELKAITEHSAKITSKLVLLVSLLPDDIEYPWHYWSIDGLTNSATKLEPAYGIASEPGPPFMCSSSEILAVHSLIYSGVRSITLFGDFNNIPMFWECVELLKPHVTIIKVGVV